jgi:hypothetical protein
MVSLMLSGWGTQRLDWELRPARHRVTTAVGCCRDLVTGCFSKQSRVVHEHCPLRTIKRNQVVSSAGCTGHMDVNRHTCSCVGFRARGRPEFAQLQLNVDMSTASHMKALDRSGRVVGRCGRGSDRA